MVKVAKKKPAWVVEFYKFVAKKQRISYDKEYSYAAEVFDSYWEPFSEEMNKNHVPKPKKPVDPVKALDKALTGYGQVISKAKSRDRDTLKQIFQNRIENLPVDLKEQIVAVAQSQHQDQVHERQSTSNSKQGGGKQKKPIEDEEEEGEQEEGEEEFENVNEEEQPTEDQPEEDEAMEEEEEEEEQIKIKEEDRRKYFDVAQSHYLKFVEEAHKVDIDERHPVYRSTDGLYSITMTMLDATRK
jgi:cobalamin biosynthesis protein CobT